MKFLGSIFSLINIVLIFTNPYKINLSKEKYLYNTELKDYIENSMIVAINIYKILTLYYTGENTLRVNQIFLELLKKNKQTYLINNYIDQEFLITLMRNFIKNIEGLEEVILEILINLNLSDKKLGLKLMDINFFSNFLINKLNNINKKSIITLLNMLKIENESILEVDKDIFHKETFITEVNRLKILSTNKKIDDDVREQLKIISKVNEI